MADSKYPEKVRKLIDFINKQPISDHMKFLLVDSIARQSSNSNLFNNPNMFTEGVTDIVPSEKHPWAGGFVSRDKPTTINMIESTNKLLSKRFPDTPEDTFIHEAAHVQQNLAKQQNKANVVDKPYFWNSFLRDVQKKHGKEFDLASNFSDNSNELIANLQSIESRLPVGKTIMDTQLGKDLFQDPESVEWYFAHSFPLAAKIYNQAIPFDIQTKFTVNDLKRKARILKEMTVNIFKNQEEGIE